jgi:FkbM family methyltransferase
MTSPVIVRADRAWTCPRSQSYAALDNAFRAGAGAVLFLVDDLTLAPDTLQISEWYLAQHFDDCLCLSLVAGWSTSLLSYAGYEGLIFPSRSLNRFGFVVSRGNWERHFRDLWLVDSGFSPHGEQGWDWEINRYLARAGGVYVLAPVTARAGMDVGGGTSDPAFDGLSVAEMAIIPNYRVVPVTALPPEVRRHALLLEQVASLDRSPSRSALPPRLASGLTEPEDRRFFVSYAQNFEDVILHRALGHISHGTYIDVGAMDPIVDSVSYGFYRLGWRGIHVEPVPAYAKALREARTDETVIEAVVSLSGGMTTLHMIPKTGLSTIDPEVAARHRHAGWNPELIEVPGVPLWRILDAVGKRDIHWLKIDVEGAEQSVIESWRPSQARPWVVICESTLPNTRIQSHHAWEPNLLAIGYTFVYFDGLSRFYVSNDHPELQAAFGLGPNVFDRFVLSDVTPYCTFVQENKAPLSRDAAEREAQLHRDAAEKEAQLRREAAEKEAQLRREAAEKEAQLRREAAEWQSSATQALKRQQDEYEAKMSLVQTKHQSSVEEYRIRCDSLESKVAQLVHREHALRAANAVSESRIYDLLHSTSWRLMEPFRRAVTFTRRLLRRTPVVVPVGHASNSSEISFEPSSLPPGTDPILVDLTKEPANVRRIFRLLTDYANRSR